MSTEIDHYKSVIQEQMGMIEQRKINARRYLERICKGLTNDKIEIEETEHKLGTVYTAKINGESHSTMAIYK